MKTTRFFNLLVVLLLVLLVACDTHSVPQVGTLDPEALDWHQLGTALDMNLVQNASNPTIALDNSGNPVVSWFEHDGTSYNIYVKRWNGTNWVQVGTTFLDVNTNQNAFVSSLALDSSGNPVVSWEESDGTSLNIYVKRWTGTSWVQVGGILDITTNQNAGGPYMALDSSGYPVVSWFESNIYVKRWNGTSWVQLDGALGGGYWPSLALDSLGNPVVGWHSSGTINVNRWNGTNWVQVGDPPNSDPASDVSLALDNLDNPVVTWHQSHNVYVKRWNGSSWVQLDGILNVNPGAADRSRLALDSSGYPVVTWYESNNIYVKRWSGTNWVQVGGILDVNPGQAALAPSLALDGSGNPVVSWFEHDGTSYNIYVKKYSILDTTPPVITPTVTGTLGTNGWYTSDVTVSWTVTDDESVISSSSGCDPVIISTDTSGTELTCIATSEGGTSSESVSIKRDATAPLVTVTGVSNGTDYTLGSVPVAGCDTQDALSGVAVAASLDITGGNTHGVGSFTVICSGALDNAGNAGSASVSYNVIYDFAGFFNPIDNPPVLNVVKAGRAIPVKFSLGGDQGLDILATASPSSVKISCGTGSAMDDIEETVTAGNSSLSYNAVTGQYSYVWKTNSIWKNTCRQFTLTLDDTSVHVANFQFK